MKCKMQMMCEVLYLSSLIHETTTLIYLLRLRFQFSNCIFTLTSLPCGDSRWTCCRHPSWAVAGPWWGGQGKGLYQSQEGVRPQSADDGDVRVTCPGDQWQWCQWGRWPSKHPPPAQQPPASAQCTVQYTLHTVLHYVTGWLGLFSVTIAFKVNG